MTSLFFRLSQKFKIHFSLAENFFLNFFPNDFSIVTNEGLIECKCLRKGKLAKYSL